jgi:sialate O-acetylesterase
VLKVEGANTIELGDVLVGEVWLCSGQSNMEMTVHGVLNQEKEIAEAEQPQIRMLVVARSASPEPRDNSGGEWKVCSPAAVGGFSAAGYFFGRELQKRLSVPVGLIDSSWGGTPIQAWTSLKAQESVDAIKPLLDRYHKAVRDYDPEAERRAYEKRLAEWKKTAGAKTERKQTPRRPEPPLAPERSPNSPATLYNGMIAPLAPYTIRGAIWYQGEANAGTPAAAKLYGVQLQTMIAEWRHAFQEPDFPFISVQLPNFMNTQVKPSETGGWPVIREEFFKSLFMVPNAGMAVTIDIGEAKDIHPRNKQEVGRRLAQWALAKTYGKDVAPCGPLYKWAQKQDGKLVLFFEYANGLVAHGEQLKGFAIAGPDKTFVWADAKIEGNTVVVSSPKVQDPEAVRYGWANNPECNLYNKAGLPASPFRTDDWNE